MRIGNLFLACVCVAGIAQAGWAHPGHAVQVGPSGGLVHYLVHPEHVAQWVIVAAIVALAVLLVRSAKKRLAPAYARARNRG